MPPKLASAKAKAARAAKSAATKARNARAAVEQASNTARQSARGSSHRIGSAGPSNTAEELAEARAGKAVTRNAGSRKRPASTPNSSPAKRNRHGIGPIAFSIKAYLDSRKPLI
jgi:hypothetical protein